MAIEVERLIAVLEANLNKYEKAMNRASAKADGTFTKIEKRGKAMETRLAAISPNLTKWLAPLAGAAGVRAFQTYADAATRVTNSLKVAGLEGKALADVEAQLYDSATKNAAPIEALAELYGRATQVQKELGVSSQELIGFTDGVATALKVSGKSAAESSGALLQLSQALGSGVVRAEEFNSVLEGAPTITKAVANGLVEAGGSISKLRNLVIEGKVSSEAFFRAFMAGVGDIAEQAGKMDQTREQAFTNLRTELTLAAGKINDATGASKLLTGAIGDLGSVVAGTGDYFETNGSKIKAWIQSVSDAWAKLEAGKSRWRSALGLDAIDDWLDGTSLIEGKMGRLSEESLPALDKQIAATEKLLGLQEAQRQHLLDMGISATEIDAKIAKTQAELAALAAQAMQGGQPEFAALPGDVPVPTRSPGSGKAGPVSTGDYPVNPGAGGGGAGSSKIDAYQREINAIKARTEALQFEASIIGATAREAERLRIESELINAAQEAGIAITPELAGQITTLADAYAGAQAGLSEMEASQQRLIDQKAALADGLQSFASGFVADLRQGVSAADAMGKALDRLLDQLINAGINMLISSLLGGGLGGFGAPANLLAKPLFRADGGIVSGPGTGKSDSIPAQLSNGEFVVNADATRRNRALLESINRGSRQVASGGGGMGGGGSQGGHVTVGVSVDDAGAIQAYVARTTGAVVAENNRQTGPKLVKSAVGASGRKFGLQQQVKQR